MTNFKPLHMEIESHGNKSTNIPIYLISVGTETAGFFALLRHIAVGFLIAEKFEMTPVVEIKRCSCYAEEKLINGSSNPFEYYYENTNNISLDDALNSNMVIPYENNNASFIETIMGCENHYDFNADNFIKSMADIYNKYFILKSQVASTLDSTLSKIFVNIKGKIIGAHVRGGEWKLNVKGHPHVITPDEHIKIIKDMFKTGEYSNIFLATDDAEALNLFISEFGDQVIYYKDVLRTDDTKGIMFMKEERENHHYLLGYEVLRDVYTLAKCDSLVAGMSNVSYFSNILKQSFGNTYDYIHIMDAGFNSDNINSVSVEDLRKRFK